MFDLGEYSAMSETVEEVEQRYSTSQQAAGAPGGTLFSHQHCFLLGKIRARAENKRAFLGRRCDSYSCELPGGKIPRQDCLLFLYKRAGRAESQRPAPVSVSWTLRTNRNSSVTCVLSWDQRRTGLHCAGWLGMACRQGGEGEEEKKKNKVGLGYERVYLWLTCQD